MIEEKKEEEEKEEKESTFRDNELEGESQKIGIFEEKEEVSDYSEVDEVDGDGKPLGPLKVKIDKGVDIANVIKFNQIYFDLDKSDIRKDAKVELEKIVEVLKTYPKIKIEIGSHTDARQDKNYNINLSQKRAESTLNYLVEKGINKDRLTAKGYGESKLVNKCADGVKCTEAEHQYNRRSTFVVVE